MKRIISSLLILAALTLASASAAAPAPASTPRTKLWAIVRSSDPATTLDALLQQPTIDGIIYYIGVSRIMPSEGVFDWAPVDAVFASCHKAGKPIKLALLGGRWVPEWFYTKGAQRFSWNLSTPYVDAGSTDTSACVPWDPIYLAEMESVATAAAKRYGNDPALVAVQVTGPSLSNGLETNLNISAAQATRIGYTPEKLIAAWVRMIRHDAAVFPKQHLSLALNNMVAGGRTKTIIQSILTAVQPDLGGRLGVLVCYATYQPWFERGNDSVDLWLNTAPATHHEAQLIDLFSAKGTPPNQVAAAVTKAHQLGAESIEVFAGDLLSAPYRNAINTALNE